MKLSSPLRIQQLLSLAGCALLLNSAATAQTDAVLIMRDNSQRPAKVVGMSATGTNLEITTPDGKGRLGLPLVQIKEVRMAQPPKLAQAFTAYYQRDYDAALAALKEVTDRYRGMPAQWAQQATAMLATMYLAKDDIPAAEAAIKDFQRFYPGQNPVQVDVSTGLVALARKDLDAARTKLTPVAQQALKEKNVPTASALAYSQTFLALGEIYESEGNYSEALEDYLRTVTLFYHDRAAAAQAQEKADALRKAHKDVTVP